MKIIRNETLIKRNARIGQFTSLGGLAVLASGMVISFTRPEYFNLAWASLIIGFVLSQIGIYFGNRWGRRPRPDERLDLALKGLDDRFTLYHFSTPVHHLLVGPPGIWVLLPHHQGGTITYAKDRWRQRGGGFFQAYLRLFAQEGLGRPDLEIAGNLETIQHYLHKRLPEVELPPIQAVLVMTNEKVIIEADDAPTPTIPARKLKEMVRKTSKEKALNPAKIKTIQEALEPA